MTEQERTTTYKSYRVLIETENVLNSAFNQQVVHLTGGQLDILRNLMQYANERTSFVSTYETGYYLTPDDDDWDELGNIISDLEVKLMGDDNVVIGYNDRIHENLSFTLTSDGDYIAATGAVPAGEVWQVQLVTIRNNTAVRGYTSIALLDDVTLTLLEIASGLAVSVPLSFKGSITLKVGDRVQVRAYGGLTGDAIDAHVWGYIMKVPE